jgi:hypothetical protein
VVNAFGFSGGAGAVGNKVAGKGGLGISLQLEEAPGMPLAAGIQQLLDRGLGEHLMQIEAAYVRAMDSVIERDKKKLRDDVEAGGFHNGAKLAKTWRGAVYPKSQPTLEPAGWLASRAKTIIDAFETGAVITVKQAKFLAIPLGPAKAIVRRMNQGRNRTRGAFGKFEKEANPVVRVEAVLGVDLIAVMDAAGDRGVLIPANAVRLTPGGREAKKQNGKATPLFVLVKQATLTKRIRGGALLREIGSGFERDFSAALRTTLAPENVEGGAS